MKVIGIEAANSFVKIKSEIGESVYLNTVRAHSNSEEEFIGVSGSVDDRFRYKGVTYTVGGTTKDYESSSARDVDRYDTDQYQLENILGIAQHAENGDTVKVVTGLPAEHYAVESNRKKVEERLVGDHTVYVNGKPITFDVAEVMVILQPLGTLTHLLISENGKARNGAERLASKDRMSLIVDIGWGTTDVAIMEGTRLRNSFGIDISMIDVYKKILDKLGLKSLVSPFKAERQLRVGDHIEYSGVEYDAKEATVSALQDTAKTILRKLQNQEKIKEYDSLIFTGGGVAALYEYMKEVLTDTNSVRIKDPQMANARGYYTYGITKK